MDERRRRQLRQEYINAKSELDTLADGYSCGQNLLEFINPRAKELRLVLDRIEEEVKEARHGAAR